LGSFNWWDGVKTVGLGALLCLAGQLAAPLAAGEPLSFYQTPSAWVTLGGEVMTDITYRPGASPDSDGELELHRSNLRLTAGIGEGVRVFFKLDFSEDRELAGDPQILAEALLVLDSLADSGVGFFAGMGQAPYGQDITLGLLQSYHHRAGRADSPEGRIFILDPPDPDWVDPSHPGRAARLAPPRPGQIERAVLAGLSYGRGEDWRLEVGAFSPDAPEDAWRLRGGERQVEGEFGVAARLWWRPLADLTLQASLLGERSSRLGRGENRLDLSWHPELASRTSWAASLGFDWRSGPWRFFGEYQEGWDWGYTKGYRASIVQAGVAREFLEAWRLGGTLELMRLDDPRPRDGRVRDDYARLALSLRYSFSEQLFVTGEYGREIRRRRGVGKKAGDFIGARIGFSF
jgi:hypothetical protein